jgi:hypothetical protein
MKIENIQLYRHHTQPTIKTELECTATISNKKIILFKNGQQENKTPRGFSFYEDDVSLKQKEFKEHPIKICLDIQNLGVANPPFYTHLKYIDKLKLKWTFKHFWFQHWGGWDERLNVIYKFGALLISISSLWLSIYTLQTNERKQTETQKTINKIEKELDIVKTEIQNIIIKSEQKIQDTTSIPKR